MKENSNLRQEGASSQFRKVKTASGKIALEAYCAVYRQPSGEDVAICSPNRGALGRAFHMITGKNMDESGVQDVWITVRGSDAL